MKTNPVLKIAAALCIGAFPIASQAQDGLMALHAPDPAPASADDEILAAIKALEEAGAILDKTDTTTVAAVDTPIPPAGLRSFKVDDFVTDDPDDPEVADVPEILDDVDAAPKIVDPPKIEAKPEPVIPQVLEDSSKSARDSRHDLQNPPEIIPQNADSLETPPVVAVTPKNTSITPKHNIQTAPIKTDTAQVASKPQTAENKQSAPKSTRAASATVSKKSQDTTKSAANTDAPKDHSLDYVTAVYRINGIDLTAVTPKNSTPTIARLYQYAFSKKLVYHRTTPSVGDLVFFHNTYDRNDDHAWNDWHTLVGIVEAVDIDGNQTIAVLTWRSGRLERLHLNLKYPELHKSRKGLVLNTQLRTDQGSNRGTAAKMFAGFANLLGDKTSVTVIDNWKPGMK